MGMFQVPVELSSSDGSRSQQQSAWVDTGAMLSQFPDRMLRDLGYRPNDTRWMRLADGSRIETAICPVVMRIGNAIPQPVLCAFGERNGSLIGAIALETFSLVADPNCGILAHMDTLMLTMVPADDVT